MTQALEGQIVTLSWEDGEQHFDCGLEDCECPEHECPPNPGGMYVTIRLDDSHARLRLSRATVILKEEQETEHE